MRRSAAAKHLTFIFQVERIEMKRAVRWLICFGAMAAPVLAHAQGDVRGKAPARSDASSAVQQDSSTSVAAQSDTAAMATTDDAAKQSPALAQNPASNAAPAGAPAPTVLPEERLPSLYFHEGTWETGVMAGGGIGAGKRSGTRFAEAGAHIGIVLTGDHLGSWLRGNFEFAGEFMPVYYVFTPDVGSVYGVSGKPIILRWNFTHGKRLAPYIQLAGGLLFTTQPVPPPIDSGGPTSAVNFTPQGSLGINFFTKPGQAIVFEGQLVHHSSAGLGEKNPGYNASFFFTLGYEWFHGWHRH
ncbi:MAG: acyloxyacyl hydrolase [Candidatus Acidiferrales bacterium]